MAKADKQLYEFGAFLLDPAERRLLREGQPVALTPKGLDLLLVLVRHSGRLLGKDELMKELWPNSFVEEGNLAFNVSRLRKALGEDQNGQGHIETVPKRGYRFVAQVRELTGEAAAQLEESLLRARTSQTRAQPLWVLWAVLAVLVVGGAATAVLQHRAHLTWAKESVARVEELVRAQRYFEAFDLAVAARRYLPNDSTIVRLMPLISDDLSISTDPAGARIYLKRFFRDASGKFPPRKPVGTTPISNLPIARGEYVMYAEKDGYAPIVRTVSSALMRAPLGFVFEPPAIRIDQKLIEGATVP